MLVGPTLVAACALGCAAPPPPSCPEPSPLPAAPPPPAPEPSEPEPDAIVEPVLQGVYRIARVENEDEAFDLEKQLFDDDDKLVFARFELKFADRQLRLRVQTIREEKKGDFEICEAHFETEPRWHPKGFELLSTIRSKGRVQRLAITRDKGPGDSWRTSSESNHCSVSMSAGVFDADVQRARVVLNTTFQGKPTQWLLEPVEEADLEKVAKKLWHASK
jgi:hypothetical protein